MNSSSATMLVLGGKAAPALARASVLCLALMLATSCSSDDPASIGGADLERPSPIGDLSVQSVSLGSVTLSWTAPALEGGAEPASEYDLRYGVGTIGETNWHEATPVTALGAPRTPGAKETFAVNGLSEDVEYQFAIRSANNRAKWSELSNIAMAEIPGALRLAEPENVIANLMLAYNDQNYAQYERLRHEDFEFQFPADEFDLSGQADGRWDRVRDGLSTQRMFDGSPSSKGEIVQSIDLTLVPESAVGWSDQVEAEFEGSLRRTYRVIMDVTVIPGGVVYQVRGLHEFYVAPVQSGGETQYRLRFWRDFGVELSKGAPSGTSWGAVKAGW